MGEWLSPFLCQYQMVPDLANWACKQTINRSMESGRWQASGVAGGDLTELRDSSQIAWQADSPATEHEPLLEFAQECLDQYLEDRPLATDVPDFGIPEGYNVIWYKPGQAYHVVHADRHPTGKLSRRYLTLLLYLNTVDQGGETEFPHQELKIKPVEGRCIIHPADWTYSHKSHPSEEAKYVFNIFYGFPEDTKPSMLSQYGID